MGWYPNAHYISPSDIDVTDPSILMLCWASIKFFTSCHESIMIEHSMSRCCHQKVLNFFNCSGWYHLACKYHRGEYDLVGTYFLLKQKEILYSPNAHTFNFFKIWDLHLMAEDQSGKLCISVLAFCSMISDKP